MKRYPRLEVMTALGVGELNIYKDYIEIIHLDLRKSLRGAARTSVSIN